MMEIQNYHAHVYFDADSKPDARYICEEAVARFGVQMGRMHDRPVGPHPEPSCQLLADPDQFAQLLPWLALHRNGLTVFIHPNTGNHLEDHRDHAIWLGGSQTLDLSIFR